MIVYDSLAIVKDETSGKEILTLDAVKLFLKVFGKSDDQVIASLVTKAIKSAESITRLSITKKTYAVILKRAEYTKISFPVYRVSNILGVFSISDCYENEIAYSSYCFDDGNQTLFIESNLAVTGKIKIIFEASIDDTCIDIDCLKVALLKHINLLYKNRLLSGLDSGEMDRITTLYRQFRV